MMSAGKSAVGSARAPSVSADSLSQGSAAAAILAAAVGCFELAVLAVLADASKTVAGWMTLYRPTGPLSGVTSVPILLWLITWWVLATRWRKKQVGLARVNTWSFLLLIVSLLITFPPIEHILLGK